MFLIYIFGTFSDHHQHILKKNHNGTVTGISGYNILQADRTSNSGKTIGGGIIVYYGNHLDAGIMSEFTVCNPSIMMNASDHNLINAVRKQPKVSKSCKKIWGRSYRAFVELMFERDIIFADWT